jgi:hypothetical protein
MNSKRVDEPANHGNSSEHRLFNAGLSVEQRSPNGSHHPGEPPPISTQVTPSTL